MSIKNFTRRQFLKSLGAGAAAMAMSGCIGDFERAFGGKKRPNIIFVLADDLGYADLGCYGQIERGRKGLPAIQTTNIDILAAEGVRFTDHYAGSTVCAPSRFCLMTGKHTGRPGVIGNKGGNSISEDEIVVTQLLKKGGYTSGLFGKWGLAGTPELPGAPLKKGFDEYFGYLNQAHAHNYYPEFLWRNDEKVFLRNEVAEESKAHGGLAGIATKRLDYSHDMIFDKALEFIKKHKDGPFFLYLPVTIPHANSEAKPQASEKFIPKELAGHRERAGMEVPDAGQYQDKDWPGPEKGYAAMVSRLDSDVGRMMALLKKLNIDEDTIVFFSSDNGPHDTAGHDPEFFDSNGPLRGIKRDLYEGGIRVPLIVRWPGKIKAGAVSNHCSAFWDFLPTFTELAGAEAPKGIDGVSMVPTLMDEPDKQKTHRFLYWEYRNKEFGDVKAARFDDKRTGDWKGVQLDFVKNPNAPIEVYNLKEDIGETRNVAAERADIVTTFKTYFRAIEAEQTMGSSMG